MKKTFMKSSSLFFFSISLLSADSFLIAQITASKIESGEVIAYCYQPMQQGIHQIYVIDEDGNNNSKLINASIGLNHHDWSPDAQKLAAVGYVNLSTWSIYRFNSDGTGLTRLTTTNNVFDSEPAWSPDGNEIAFTRIYYNQNFRNEIWVMNSDGSNQHYIGVEGFAAKWSHDGAKFIFTNTGDWNASGLKGSDIKTCNVNGTNVQQITHTAGDEWSPSWSPDGNEILFGYSSDGNYASNEIFKMNSDTTGRQQLTINNSWDGLPRWSRDGSRICYASDISAYQHWEVYIMNNDGSNIKRVTNTSSDATAINPVWMPIDGSTSINEGDLLSKTFQLYQNYPNPFNPSTTIVYHIPSFSFVTIKVYDVLGNEIATLVNEDKSVGSYITEFTGEGLPSGVYLYKLRAGVFNQVMKMIIIR
jgi:TolB protein